MVAECSVPVSFWWNCANHKLTKASKKGENNEQNGKTYVHEDKWTKASKKGENKEQNGKTYVHEDKWTKA